MPVVAVHMIDAIDSEVKLPNEQASPAAHFDHTGKHYSGMFFAIAREQVLVKLVEDALRKDEGAMSFHSEFSHASTLANLSAGVSTIGSRPLLRRDTCTDS